jgi:hypothetical protein
MVPGVSSGATAGQHAAGHLCRSASRLPRCERGSDYGPTWPEVAEDQFAVVLRCPVATTAPRRLCVTEKSAPRSREKRMWRRRNNPLYVADLGRSCWVRPSGWRAEDQGFGGCPDQPCSASTVLPALTSPLRGRSMNWSWRVRASAEMRTGTPVPCTSDPVPSPLIPLDPG